MRKEGSGKQLEIELIAITADAEKVIEQAGRTCYLSTILTKVFQGLLP